MKDKLGKKKPIVSSYRNNACSNDVLWNITF